MCGAGSLDNSRLKSWMTEKTHCLGELRPEGQQLGTAWTISRTSLSGLLPNHGQHTDFKAPWLRTRLFLLQRAAASTDFQPRVGCSAATFPNGFVPVSPAPRYHTNTEHHGSNEESIQAVRATFTYLYRRASSVFLIRCTEHLTGAEGSTSNCLRHWGTLVPTTLPTLRFCR